MTEKKFKCLGKNVENTVIPIRVEFFRFCAAMVSCGRKLRISGR